MKRLILLVMVIGCATPQSPSNAPESANVIIIRTHDSPETAFRKMARLFVQESFELETNEPKLSMLTTKITERKYGVLSAGRVALKFIASIDDADSGSVIQLSGKFLADAESFKRMLASMGYPGASQSFDADGKEIRLGGMSGSPVRESWNFMNAIASKYESSTLEYRRLNR